MNAAMPNDVVIVSSSPHAHSGETVSRIMLDVLIALMPALVAAICFFRWQAVRLVVVCVAVCLLAEWICRKVMRRNNTIGDFSAAVTGLLLAFNLPPAIPTWMAIVGSLFAIVIAKQLFGGLGYNPFNPALMGRAFMLISFTGPMTSWSGSKWMSYSGITTASPLVDAVTYATPLNAVKEALKAGNPIPFEFTREMGWQFFFGNMNGCIGETSALALLIGAAYLLVRRVITWHVPVSYIGTAFIFALIMHLSAPQISMPPMFHLLTGGLLLGAFFMATDMVTTPITRSGLLIFGAGCGLLTMVIRTVIKGDFPEGTSFAILIMNAFTPLINRATRPKVFGCKPKCSAA